MIKVYRYCKYTYSFDTWGLQWGRGPLAKNHYIKLWKSLLYPNIDLSFNVSMDLSVW